MKGRGARGEGRGARVGARDQGQDGLRCTTRHPRPSPLAPRPCREYRREILFDEFNAAAEGEDFVAHRGHAATELQRANWQILRPV